MEKVKFAIEVAKFLVYLYGIVKALVLEVEDLIPESGSGAKKFAIVKKAIIEAGEIAGFADGVATYAEGAIDKAINNAVSEEINGGN